MASTMLLAAIKKEAIGVQFNTSLITSLFLPVFDEICGTAINFVFYFVRITPIINCEYAA